MMPLDFLRLARRFYSSHGWRDFAQHARAYRPALVEAVLNIIGHWPSSEPELRALQVLA